MKWHKYNETFFAAAKNARVFSRGLLVLPFAISGALTRGQELLDKLDDSLHLQTPNGYVQTDLSGLLDAEGYYVDQPPPGLVFTDDHFFFNPRLSLFLDTKIGEHLYSLLQVRFDRGFDPGSKPHGDVRFDEYLLRYTPFDDPRLNLQAGKFATLTGNWVPRHLSWDNPFINAPLPYENVTIASDQVATPSAAAFLARKTKPDQKGIWNPMIWGPSYAVGGAVFGRVEQYEYALELKNSALASRPYAWDPTNVGFDHPTVSGRIGVRPDAAWNVGANASYGTYLLPNTAGLPGNQSYSDFHQLMVGPDISFAWHHWQLWAEAYASRFDVPAVGNADTVAYYLEAKYKIDSNWFIAWRWNQQLFDNVPNGKGGEERWDHDIWRAETALGYRFTRHLQAKLQYSYSRQNGTFQQGEQMVATQLTLKF
jgi:hypothetical protein